MLPLVRTTLASFVLFGPVAAQEPARVSLAASPVPDLRTDAALVFDERRGRSVLFGGQTGSGSVAGDTWEWDGVAWTRHEPQASPRPRFGHAMVCHPALGPVLYGGSSNGTDVLGDMWRWDGATWHPLTAPTMPPALQEPAMTWHAGTSAGILLFGGRRDGSSLSNETWLFDGSTWSRQSGTGPSARWKAALVHAPTVQRSYLIGGSGPGSEEAETWAWDGATWSVATPLTHRWRGASEVEGAWSLPEPAVVWNEQLGALAIMSGFHTVLGTPSATAPAAVTWSVLRHQDLHFFASSAGASACFDAVRGRVVLLSDSRFFPGPRTSHVSELPPQLPVRWIPVQGAQ